MTSFRYAGYNIRFRTPSILKKYVKVKSWDDGYIVVMADYGAFIEIAPGVEGLIHVSEMSWSQHLRSAQDFMKVGDEVEAVILTLDRDERKMSLGNGTSDIRTGIGFFNHMLEQIAKHGMIDLNIRCEGDLEVDEHHTIEDVALALGECLRKALGDKRGIERYGYCLPMDDSLCRVALDFGGRPWLVWDAEFRRERIGEMPTEMFPHFFKSLSDAALMNLNIKAEGTNEHHKIEGIFKALARSVRMAVRRDVEHFVLPSSKGTL